MRAQQKFLDGPFFESVIMVAYCNDLYISVESVVKEQWDSLLKTLEIDEFSQELERFSIGHIIPVCFCLLHS